MIATSDLCTHCFATETYEHILLICPRFQQIQSENIHENENTNFNTVQLKNIDKLIFAQNQDQNSCFDSLIPTYDHI